MTSYPTPAFRRTALAPGILGALVLLAGVALLGSSGFVWILFATAILALIVAVYAWQAKQWWWLLPLAAIAVVWNPVFPLAVRPAGLWLGLQYGAILVFIASGILIRVPNPEDRNARRQGQATRKSP